MTPREVQLSIRAASEMRLDRIDELTYAAWHGALWGGVQRVKKLPPLQDALAKRDRRRGQKPRTIDEDIRRWETFFRASRKERAN